MDARAVWYFDFISPFAYLQWQHVKAIANCELEYRPILFAGLLSHHGTTGPAELPGKRLFTYRHVQWRANKVGVPLRFPPAHPFNPLPVLRLCIAAGNTPAAIDAIFNAIWRDGLAPDDPAVIRQLAESLGVENAERALQDPGVKARLQENFRLAVEDGVFGVPSLVVHSKIFWGEDATPMFLEYLADPALFGTAEMQALETLPTGAVRKPRG